MSEGQDAGLIASFDGAFNQHGAGAGFVVTVHLRGENSGATLLRGAYPLQVYDSAAAEDAALLIMLKVIVQLFTSIAASRMIVS